jgi:hypothetical protein
MSFRLSLWLVHNRDLGEKWSVAPHEGQLLFFLLGSEIASLKAILPLVLSFLFWILSFPFRLRPAIFKVRYHPLLAYIFHIRLTFLHILWTIPVIIGSVAVTPTVFANCEVIVSYILLQ